MNKQLEDLYQRAVQYAFDQRFKQLPSGPRELQEVINEKFAELIIKECIGLIVKENEGPAITDWGAGWTTGLDTVKLAIEEHFGVEQ